MIRKWAGILSGLAFIVTLGLMLALAQPPVSSGAIELSAPCTPASPVLRAAGESKAVSNVDASIAIKSDDACTGLVRASRVETVARTIPPPAPRIFPPLLHRPPPACS